MIIVKGDNRIMKCDRCGKIVAEYKDSYKPKQPQILCSNCIIPQLKEDIVRKKEDLK
jgi:NAD-dependent SIR2 family protein deacetylase